MSRVEKGQKKTRRGHGGAGSSGPDRPPRRALQEGGCPLRALEVVPTAQQRLAALGVLIPTRRIPSRLPTPPHPRSPSVSLSTQRDVVGVGQSPLYTVLNRGSNGGPCGVGKRYEGTEGSKVLGIFFLISKHLDVLFKFDNAYLLAQKLDVF